jgi:hypothetical protein
MVVLSSKNDRLPEVYYCSTPAIAVMLVELGKFSMLADMIQGEGDE